MTPAEGYTVAQVAEALGVSEASVHGYIRAKALTATKATRGHQITAEAVYEFLRQRVNKALDEAKGKDDLARVVDKALEPLFRRYRRSIYRWEKEARDALAAAEKARDEANRRLERIAGLEGADPEKYEALMRRNEELLALTSQAHELAAHHALGRMDDLKHVAVMIGLPDVDFYGNGENEADTLRYAIEEHLDRVLT